MSENIHIKMLDQKLKEAKGKNTGDYFKYRSRLFKNYRKVNVEHYPIYGSEVPFTYYKGIEKINENHYKFIFRKHIEEETVFWNIEEISIGIFDEKNADKSANTCFDYTIIDCDDVSNHEDITIESFTIENAWGKKEELVFAKIKTDSPYQSAVNEFNIKHFCPDYNDSYYPKKYIYCRKSNLYYCFVVETSGNIIRAFTIKKEKISYCPERYRKFCWKIISAYWWSISLGDLKKQKIFVDTNWQR